jgi:hypothetical protein
MATYWYRRSTNGTLWKEWVDDDGKTVREVTTTGTETTQLPGAEGTANPYIPPSTGDTNEVPPGSLFFPNLAKSPSVAIEQEYEDPTIRDEMENGLVSTRPRWSRVRRSFRVPYSGLPPADQQAIDDFVTKYTKGGSGDFYWVHPETGIAHHVRFAKGGLPRLSQLNTANGVRYNCSFALEEV